jgi:hypothetical protein
MELVTLGHSDPDPHPTVAFSGPINETVPDTTAAELLSATRTLLATLPATASATEIQLTAGTDVTLSLAYDGPEVQDTHALRALRARTDNLGGAVVVDSPADGTVRILWRVPATGDDHQPGVIPDGTR